MLNQKFLILFALGTPISESNGTFNIPSHIYALSPIRLLFN